MRAVAPYDDDYDESLAFARPLRHSQRGNVLPREGYLRVAWLIALILVTCFMVLVAVLVPLNYMRQIDARADDWQSHALRLHTIVTRLFEHRLAVLDLVSFALAAFEDPLLTVDVFDLVMRTGTIAVEGSDLGLVEYIPRVEARDVPVWEKRILQSYPDLLTKCNVTQTGIMPVYFPIAYINPRWLPPNVRALCFNILSRSSLAGVIAKATSTGLRVASLPVQLIQGGTASLLYVAVRSVTNSNRTLALLAYVLRPEFFLSAILADSANRKVALWDLTDTPHLVTPFPNETTTYPVVAQDARYIFCRNYTIADRIWHACQLPSAAFVDQSISFYPVGAIIVGACGALLVLLVGLAFGASQYHREQLRRRQQEAATIHQARVDAKVRA